MTGGEIDNFKTLASDMSGVVVATAGTLLTTINNASGAVLSGAIHAIDDIAGRFSLTNHGVVSGTILDEANLGDMVYNFGVIKNPVFLGGGNDVFKDLGAGKSAPVFGGDGNDRIIGGSQADQIHGEAGNDTVTGGGANDSFYFDTALNSANNVDTITDFTPGHDKMILDVPFFGGSGALGPLGPLSAAHFHTGAPVNKAAQIDYSPRNGFLFFDADGKGPTLPIHFATLATHPLIHNTDFFLTFIV
jgi:Ca2+-binding RTX toxin-like protein